MKHIQDLRAARVGYLHEMREKAHIFYSKVMALSTFDLPPEGADWEDGEVKALEKTVEEMSSINASSVKMSQPRDYTHVFDKVIGMLEISTETEFKIDSDQHQAWVEGNFTEIRDFQNDSRAYIAKALSS